MKNKVEVWTEYVLLIGIIELHIFAVHVFDGTKIIEILILVYFSRR